MNPLTRSFNLTSLLVLAVSFTQAQTGYVANAIGSTNSSLNVLAPAMLATIPSLLPPNSALLPPGTPAQIFIRPASSADAIPVTNLTLASTGDLAFIVPAGVPPGTAELYWSIAGGPFIFIDVTVSSANFELAPFSNLANPARPSQTITFDGSGLGYGNQVTASIGGQPAAIVYAGRGTPAGHDQIQLQIPANPPTGCYVPLTLAYGQSSLATTISITNDGSPCPHPFQLSTSDLKTLDAGGSVNVAVLNLSTTFDATTASAVHRDESVSASTLARSASDFAKIFNPAPSPSGCSIAPPSSAVFAVFSLLYDPNTTRDLGPGLILKGPAGGNYYPNTPAPADGTLTNPPAPSLAPGKWSFLIPASPDLAPAQFDFTLPAPFQITGPVPLSFTRNSDQTITWNGTPFDPTATIAVSLTGHASGGTTRMGVICYGPASAGSLAIPASFLANFAPQSIAALDVRVSSSGLIPQHTVLQTKSGNTLVIYLSYSTDDRRPVDFQ